MNLKHLILILSSLVLVTTAAKAQNVGIGDPAAPFTPAHRLHLKGNFLLEDGDFRPGDNPGTAGQVLTSQGAGQPPSWEDATGGGTLVGTVNYVTRWIANDNIGIGQIMDNNTQIHAGKGAGLPILPTSDLNVFMQVTSTQPATANNQSIALQANSTDSVAIKGISTNSIGVWGETASPDIGVLGINTSAGGATGVQGEAGNDATQDFLAFGVRGVTSRTMDQNTQIGEFNSAGVSGVSGGNGHAKGVQSIAFTDAANACGTYAILLPGDDFFNTGTMRPNAMATRSDSWHPWASGLLATTSILGDEDKNNPTLPGVSTLRGNNLMLGTFNAGVEGFAVNTGDANADGPGLSDPTTEGRTFGVLGATNSKGRGSAGVYGIGRYTGGERNYGVYGVGYSGADFTAGVYGTDFDDLLTRTDLTNGSTLPASTTSYGVIGNSENNVGVLGVHLSNAGDGAGTEGYTYSQDGFASGVFGLAAEASGLNGPTFGVYGISDGDFEDAAGVYGQVENSFGANPRHGVLGQSNETSDGTAGVYGWVPLANQGQVYGVLGVSRSDAAASAGVRGVSTSPDGANPTYGVYGFTNSTNASAAGVYGTSVRGGGQDWAGWFEGNLRVVGSITADVKPFTIDHPDDPANKYLTHYSIEAPEALNVYSGSITTDAKGDAVVVLPEYFQSANKDFLYQLTCINQFAQAIVTQKIQDNRFRVKTDKPNVELNWVVYATRNDASYNLLKKPAVRDKEPENRGKYLLPQAYGQPREKAIGYVANPGTEHVNRQPGVAPDRGPDPREALRAKPNPKANWNEYFDSRQNGEAGTQRVNLPPNFDLEKFRKAKEELTKTATPKQ